MFIVYALVDPRTDIAFYIGQTGRPKRRLAAHLRMRTITSAGYIEELIDIGLKPKMIVLEEFPTRREAVTHESKLLSGHKLKCIPLANNKYGRKRPKNYPP
ncbi:GIY-YIG nuclease family protein, partial [Streptomyces eurythermus]